MYKYNGMNLENLQKINIDMGKPISPLVVKSDYYSAKMEMVLFCPDP